VLIAVIVYVGLQIAFIVALNPADIAQGWGKLHFVGMFGPLAAIALAVGAAWWAWILYLDAVVSPLGTAFIYITACPRIIMAAGEMGNAPKHVIKLNRHGVPWIGLVVSYVVGVIFFFPFPSWQKLVSAVSLITVLSYAIGPVIVLHLRKILPDAERPFRLRAVGLISALSFIAANWIIYWTGYDTVKWLFGFVGVYVVAYLIWYFASRAPLDKLGWRQAWWLAPYFAGMWAISYYGPSSENMGGHGAFGFFTGMWIIAGFSIVILGLALATGQDTEAAERTNAIVQNLGSRGEVILRTAEETGP
jgi:amino acid transporter